jgi:hypothetical protein
VLQEAKGQAAELAGRIVPLVLALTGATAGQSLRKPPGHVNRQIPHAIDQDRSLICGRQDEQPLASIILDDRGPWCLGTQPSEAIAFQRPPLLDQLRGRMERARAHANVQEKRVEDRFSDALDGDQSEYGKHPKYLENHALILAKQRLDHKPLFIDFNHTVL